MIYLQLFLSFIQIGLFSIGGGYAAIPLIQTQAVDIHHWLTMSEFSDLVTIAEMTPGPIAVNSATFVGIRIAGIPGAIIATFGVILPSIFIVSLLAYIYRRYKNAKGLDSVLGCLRLAVVALIASAGISMFITAVTVDGTLATLNIIALVIFVLAFIALRKTKLSPILIMVVCGVLNVLVYIITELI